MRNAKDADKKIGFQSRLLTVEEVAKRLHVSVRTVWRLDEDKKLPAAKRIGRSKRWDATELELWLVLNCPTRKKFETFLRNRKD